MAEQTPEQAPRAMVDAFNRRDLDAFRRRSMLTPRSRLFTVRLWKERTADGSEYRGSVRDALGGAFLGFRDWSDLCAFMIERMEENETGRRCEDWRK